MELSSGFSALPVKMADQTLLASILALLFGFAVLYRLVSKKNGETESESLAVTTSTTIISRSKNGADVDADIIIVGAGVAGAALAHTLGKVRFC